MLAMIEEFLFMFILKGLSVMWNPVLPWICMDYRYATYVLQWSKEIKTFLLHLHEWKVLTNRFLHYSMCYNICNLSLVQFHADITDYVPTTFHTLQNLTHLRLLCGFNCNGFNLNFLNDFLGCFPNLEVLVLEVCWK